MSISWDDIFLVVEDLKKSAMRYAARGDARSIPATGVIFSEVNGAPAVQRLYLSDSIDGVRDLQRFSSMIRAVSSSSHAKAAGFMTVMPCIIYTGDEEQILEEIAAVGGFHNHPGARYSLFIHMEHGHDGYRHWCAEIVDGEIAEFRESDKLSFSDFPPLLPAPGEDVGQA